MLRARVGSLGRPGVLKRLRLPNGAITYDDTVLSGHVNWQLRAMSTSALEADTIPSSNIPPPPPLSLFKVGMNVNPVVSFKANAELWQIENPAEKGKNVDEHLALLDASLRMGDIERASRVLRSCQKMSLSLPPQIYTTYIQALLRAGKLNKALSVLQVMHSMNVTATSSAAIALVKAAAETQESKTLQRVFNILTEYAPHTLVDGIWLHDEFNPEEAAFVERTLRLWSKDNNVNLIKSELDRLTDITVALRKEESDRMIAMRSNLSVLSEDTDLTNKQIQLETRNSETERQRLQQLLMQNSAMVYSRTDLAEIIYEWRQGIEPVIREEIEKFKRGESGMGRRVYGPFLSLIPPEIIADAAVLETLLQLSGTSSVRVTSVVMAIGKAIETNYNSLQLKKNSKKLHMTRSQVLGLSRKQFDLKIRKAFAEAQNKEQTELGDWIPKWNSSIKAKIGSVILQILVDSARIKALRPGADPNNPSSYESVPAFFNSYQFYGTKRVGVVRFHPLLGELIANAHDVKNFMGGDMLPMLVKPQPWLNYNTGGYLMLRRPCMRVKESPEQLEALRDANDKGQLHRVLAALDILGSTEWIINKKVLSVALHIWGEGGGKADLPQRSNVPLPNPPQPHPETGQPVPAEMRKYISEKSKVEKMNREAHSLRCDVNYKLEIARAYQDFKFYFPHSLDFRGRAYPMPPHLNHIGSDLNRGLLLFREGKPLGESGLRWLKIHLANLLGQDKLSFDGRVQYVDQHLDQILEVADDPIKNQWWTTHEDCWQALATCIEFAAAIRSPDPSKFISHLPVHQDGSCNGLQHYAALGGDIVGAESVNLRHSAIPQDVYAVVANKVAALIDEAAKDSTSPDHELAKLLQGKVSRKVVKQTVMTNVYGVTFIGARIQIENRLKEKEIVPEDMLFKASIYITRLVFASLGEIFKGAHEIQNWLTDTAREIAKSAPPHLKNSLLQKKKSMTPHEFRKHLARAQRGETLVVWTTPLGLPIVQPYKKKHMKQIRTTMQTIQVYDPRGKQRVHISRQRSAFPPNFIHSLDSTHMLMTALSCNDANLTFASVHDSYWTHACSVDQMNSIIRQEFVKLHSQPIMQNLWNEFNERYGTHLVWTKAVKLSKKQPKIDTEVEPGLQSDAEDIVAVEEPDDLDLSLADSTSTQDQFNKIEEEEEEQEEEEEELSEQQSPTESTTQEGSMDELDDLLNDDSSQQKPTTKVPTWMNEFRPFRMPPLPKRGEFDIRDVMQSDYFFD